MSRKAANLKGEKDAAGSGKHDLPLLTALQEMDASEDRCRPFKGSFAYPGVFSAVYRGIVQMGLKRDGETKR